MSEYLPDNYWMICLNCEHEFSMEEYLIDDNFECPFCESREFRPCDSVGGDLDFSTYKSQIEENWS